MNEGKSVGQGDAGENTASLFYSDRPILFSLSTSEGRALWQSRTLS